MMYFRYHCNNPHSAINLYFFPRVWRSVYQDELPLLTILPNAATFPPKINAVPAVPKSSGSADGKSGDQRTGSEG